MCENMNPCVVPVDFVLKRMGHGGRVLITALSTISL